MICKKFAADENDIRPANRKINKKSVVKNNILFRNPEMMFVQLSAV